MIDLKQLAIKTMTTWSGCRNADGSMDNAACLQAHAEETALFAAIDELHKQLAAERALNKSLPTVIADTCFTAGSSEHLCVTRFYLDALHEDKKGQSDIAQDALNFVIANERNRIAEEIKAADNHCADGDYMMDSDDCIHVVLGTWIPPIWDYAGVPK